METVVKEVQEETQQKPQGFRITHTHHDKGDYSISIETENRHISLTTWSYNHRPGYRAGIAIFDLTINDIQKLGEALITEALKIKAEATS